eukprot:COSAG02_NODE_1026_length_15134_cov_382.979714_11_plen_70_part_00
MYCTALSSRGLQCHAARSLFCRILIFLLSALPFHSVYRVGAKGCYQAKVRAKLPCPDVCIDANSARDIK